MKISPRPKRSSNGNGRVAAARDPKPDRALNRALVNSIAEGDVATARKLISRGANVNFRNRDGETPLSYAAAWNQLEALRLLLAHGANPNAADRTGGTPLMLAAQHGDLETIRELLRSKADPRAQDSAGRTAVEHADWRDDSRQARQEIRRIIVAAAKRQSKSSARSRL